MQTVLRRAGICFLLLAFGVYAIIGCGNGAADQPGSTPQPGPQGPPPPGPNPPPSPPPPPPGGQVALITETVASGLAVPWEIVFAPDGRIFFTEQPGRLRVIQNGQLLAAPALDFTGRVPGGEAGMLGLDIDRNFASNGFLYVFYCYETGESPTGVRCRVARLVMTGNQAREVAPPLLDILGVGLGRHHNAGRIKIGPDNLLYVATGDLGQAQRAQNLNDPAGKILRITLDGQPAPGNPFSSQPLVYAWGLRDPQGLAFDSSGQLYGTDHGNASHDEVNIIRAGGNYGWPTCEGICNNPLFVDPVKLFFPETAAPSGATFYNGAVIPQWNGSLLFATLGLRDNTFAHHIHRIKFDAPGGTRIVEEEVLYRNQFGRIRTVVQGPDGFVYFSTSNGGPGDKIVRIRPKP
jgi:aldose sugar dehydrogenase